MKTMKTKDKKAPKKLYLTEEERANLKSREAKMREYEYFVHLINNDIVGYLKGVVYKRLNLDINKDYPVSTNGEYLIVEEKEGGKEEAK